MPIRHCTVLLLLVWADIAAAHPAPFSFLDLHLEGAATHGSLVIHDFDAAHELKLDEPEALLDSEAASIQGEALARIIESRLRISLDGRAATFDWGAIEVLVERQSLRFPFVLRSAEVGRVDIEALLFPYDASHQTFINIYEKNDLRHQAILDANRNTLRFYSSGVQGRWAVVQAFVRAGIEHIFIGVDHILFLFGLLLLGGSLRRLAVIITAFTVGHSITLSLAVLDIVRIAANIVEPAIALSIVVVGVDNLLVKNQQKPSAPMRDMRSDIRPWLALAFGLIHGFGFAAVLLELSLPRAALGWSLAAFNVGVEVGQLIVVMILASLLLLLRRYQPMIAERCVKFGSIGVVAAGTYWFVQRIGLL